MTNNHISDNYYSPYGHRGYGVCPNCGHCPMCGRSNYPMYPKYPTVIPLTIPDSFPTWTQATLSA